MNKGLVFLLIIIILLVGGMLYNSCTSSKSIIDKRVVTELNLEKYLGTWYEIARYDHRFERGMVGVTANYSMRDDGKIKVINSGYQGSFSGEYKEAIGKAKIPNPEEEPAKLKVSFFWIFYGDYYVLELDEDYQWVVIGSSSDKYLWILSRNPHISEDLYEELIKKIESRGYDSSKLIKVAQK